MTEPLLIAKNDPQELHLLPHMANNHRYAPSALQSGGKSLTVCQGRCWVGAGKRCHFLKM